MSIKRLSALVSILSVLTVFGSDTQAKSVYAITDHGNSLHHIDIACNRVEVGTEKAHQFIINLFFREKIRFPVSP